MRLFTSIFTWRRNLVPFFLCLSIFTITFSNAQSEKCHSCIERAIPTVSDCGSLSDSQYALIDKIIHGIDALPKLLSSFKTTEPLVYNCLNSMMWDIVHYKAKLWGTCLDPENACLWPEMMHYLEMIPKIASIYGAQNPPASALVDGPA